MKWKEKLAECNLNEENISQGLKTKIKDFYEIIEGIEEAKEKLANPSLNDDVEEIQSDLEELEESLEVADQKLVRAIELFDKNKDKYAELARNLSNGRPRKDGKPNPPKNVAQPQAQPQPQPQGQVAQQGGQTNPLPLTPTEEVPNGDGKKGSGLAWKIFVGVLAVATLGVAVKMFKNDD